MAKKRNKIFTDFLDVRIAQKEKQIVEHNGLVPLDFDQLARYHACRQYYEDEVAK